MKYNPIELIASKCLLMIISLINVLAMFQL